MGDSIWVNSTPTFDGKGYVVSLEMDDDEAYVLDPEVARIYAFAVIEAAARAEYDNAVYRQLSEKLRITDQQTVLQMIVDLRKDRPDIVQPPLPFEIVPCVAATRMGQDDAASVQIHRGQEVIGQMDIPAARSHAEAVLELLTVADLDSAYFRQLVGLVKIEPERARQVIDDLANWRPSD